MDSYDQKGSKSKLIIVKKNRMTSHKPTYVHNRSSFFSKIFECLSKMFQLNLESHPSSSLLNPANAHAHGKEKMVEYLWEDSYSKSKNVSRNGYTYQLWKSNWTNQQVNLSTRSDELSFFWFLTVFFFFLRFFNVIETFEDVGFIIDSSLLHSKFINSFIEVDGVAFAFLDKFNKLFSKDR